MRHGEKGSEIKRKDETFLVHFVFPSLVTRFGEGKTAFDQKGFFL